jgi:diguanylate cyclase (GGDEF)-like protein/PAS domain S-box-containing protein
MTEESKGILRLLVIHDSMNESEELVSALRNAGYGVRASRANDAEGVQTVLDEKHTDLILCSTNLKEYSIQDLGEAVAATGRAVPVVAVTGDARGASIADVMRAGARDLVHEGDDEHLRLVVARELADLQVRRALVRCEAGYRDSEQRCQALLDSSRDAITYVLDGMHIYANRTYLKMFGFSEAEDVDGTPVMDMLSPDDHDKFKDVLRRFARGDEQVASVDVIGLRADGTPMDVTMELSRATFEGEDCTQIIIRDNSAQRELANKVQDLKNRDLLTNLYNRQYLLAQMDRHMAEASAGTTPWALLFIQLNAFDSLRDAIGIGGADLVLGDIAGLLQGVADPDHLVASFGDDSFAILAPDLDRRQAAELGEKIRAAIEEHISDVDGSSVSTTCSVAVGMLLDSGGDSQRLVSALTKTVHELNAEGGNRVRAYNPIEHEHTGLLPDKQWVALIRDALKNNRFKLLFQPIASLHGEASERYELLIRLRKPNGDVILPGQFFPVCEKYGLTTMIDRWVIAHAIHLLGKRRQQGKKTVFFIKITAASLSDKSLLPWVRERLKMVRLQGDSLVFEVAETIALPRLKDAVRFHQGLQQLHCGLAIEHFGSGLNSLHLFRHLQADYLKIDSSFISDLGENEESQEMVKSITDAAHAAGKLTIAECVEQAESLPLLWQFGINYIQGYFLAPPGEKLDYDFVGAIG